MKRSYQMLSQDTINSFNFLDFLRGQLREWSLSLFDPISGCFRCDEIFPYDQNPFNTPNASNEEIDLMPWALRWKDRIPYTLSRGLVFQNSRRMIQLATYEDLVRLPGSYWVDMKNMILHIHPFDAADPNEQRYEVTVQEHLLKAEKAGLGYIRIKGFVFEHAGNGFPRIDVGALYVYGGHHWIIEDNVVRHCNSVGIEAGARTTESRISTEEEKVRVENHEGGFIVRNNMVYDCGTGGIQGHTLINTLIENNRIYHIGWQDAERYWECAAIKTLVNNRTIVRRNVIYDVECASGIWLDWDNRNCRSGVETLELRVNEATWFNIAPNVNRVDVRLEK